MDDDTFKQQIRKHDQAKTWQKKLKLLKQGLLEQRRSKAETMEMLKYREDRIEALQGEIQWKNRQNETLGREIKAIKDQILEQRNRKRKLREEMLALTDSNNESGSDQTKTTNN